MRALIVVLVLAVVVAYLIRCAVCMLVDCYAEEK